MPAALSIGVPEGKVGRPSPPGRRGVWSIHDVGVADAPHTVRASTSCSAGVPLRAVAPATAHAVVSQDLTLCRSRTLLTMGGSAGCRRPQLRLRVEIRPKSKFGESVRGTLQDPSRRAAPKGFSGNIHNL